MIGAGVIGISIARELRRRHGARVLVIEKEAEAGRHASGRNSGVLHAGVYYAAGSLKARLCVEGNRRMREYCLACRIPMTDKGKVIVARHPGELPVLQELHRRSQANDVRASLIGERELRDIEPCAKTIGQALYVQDTAVVNPHGSWRRWSPRQRAKASSFDMAASGAARAGTAQPKPRMDRR